MENCAFNPARLVRAARHGQGSKVWPCKKRRKLPGRVRNNALLNTLEMTAARNGAGKEPSIRRNKAPGFRAHLSAP